MPPGASTMSGEVDWLFYFITWLSTGFFVIITFFTIWFMFIYKRKPGEKSRLTIPFHHSTALEVFWTAVPTVLIFVIFIVGFQSFMRLFVIPTGAYEINVTAQQWGWEFHYPNGGVSVGLQDKEDPDEFWGLVVPADRPIMLRMNSIDVLHSLFIPDFRVKMDIIPNRYTSLWFNAIPQKSQDDTWEIQHDLYCTEYCGDKHSQMLSTVRVMDNASFDTWVASAVRDIPPNKVHSAKMCNSCHSLDGTTVIGPSWQGLWKRNLDRLGGDVDATKDYISESLRDPGAYITDGFENANPMNAFPINSINDSELDGLIDYIRYEGWTDLEKWKAEFELRQEATETEGAQP